MKTASVADLRNRFSNISAWVKEGEQVTITKRGKPFAILSPTTPAKSLKKKDRMKRLIELNPEGRKTNDSLEVLSEERIR